AGDRAYFNVLVRNLGGAMQGPPLSLDFRANGGLEYESVSIVGATQGFTCAVHNPPLAGSYVSCSGGTLGDPNADPTNDDSVNVFMSARVLPRGLGPSVRTFTATANAAGLPGESSYTNNTDTWNFQYR
ncbi:MAG: hypothetical protein J2P17_33540, partial [Mycobacterium sp.]|nr:hypothetical protein [Mycobacterium sp.]